MNLQGHCIEKTRQINKKIRLSLIVVIIVLSLLNCFQIFWYIYEKKQVEVHCKTNAQQEVERVLTELYNRFAPLMDITETFAKRLENREIPKNQLLFNLKQVMEQNPQLFAFGVAFEPYMYDEEVKAYAKYYVRKNNDIELVHLEDIEDYLGVQNNWYHDEMANGPVWVGPYYMPEVDTTIVEYGVPFYYRDEKSGEKVPAGLVYINYSIEDVKNIMNSLDLGKYGYGFIITEQGKYVAHPIQNYVKGERTIFEIARELNSADLKFVGDLMTTGNSGTMQYYNELNGQYSWLIYRPFESTKWSVGVVFIKNESISHIIQQRRQLICIALGMVLLTIMACFFIAFISKGNEKVLWRMVFLLSSVVMITICFIWYLALVMTPYQKEQQKIILDQAGLNKFLHDYLKAHDIRHEKPPVQIPTGVFVQSIEFENANDVRVTGYIWQKYQDGLHDHVSQGIVLPVMVEGEISEAYRVKNKNV